MANIDSIYRLDDISLHHYSLAAENRTSVDLNVVDESAEQHVADVLLRVGEDVNAAHEEDQLDADETQN